MRLCNACTTRIDNGRVALQARALVAFDEQQAPRGMHHTQDLLQMLLATHDLDGTKLARQVHARTAITKLSLDDSSP